MSEEKTEFEPRCLEHSEHEFKVWTRMWVNDQRDGRPAEYRWRPLFNAAVWLTPTTRVSCSDAAKTRNSLKFAGVPQTRQQITAVSRPKFTILWGHEEEVSMFNKFFSDCRYMPIAAKIWPNKVVRWCQNGDFCVLYFSEPRAAHFGHAF